MSHQTFGTWSPLQRSLHINNLELLAVHLALQHFLPLVINKVMIVMSNNTMVISQIKNQGGTHSQSLFRQTVLLLEWVDSRRITLVLRHIPGHLSMVADCLSRRHQIINSEWPWSQQILHHMWHLMGPAPCRPLCHVENRPPAHVRLSTPRPSSMEDQRLVLSVDESVGLHVSTLPSHPGSSPEDTGVQLPSHPSGSSVAVSTLVPSPTVSAGRPPETHTSSVKATAPTTVPNLPPRSPSHLSLHVWRLSSRPLFFCQSRLFLAGGNPHCLVTPPLHIVCLQQQVAHFHSVVPRHWT